MKILITVGTTPFDSLISALQDCETLAAHEVLVQHAQGIPSECFESIPFIDDIQASYTKADLVITHAGAGSVYKLLELGKPLLVVPNLERADKHQEELARFVEQHRYAVVCWDLPKLNENVLEALDFNFAPYQKTSFFKAPELKQQINELYFKDR